MFVCHEYDRDALGCLGCVIDTGLWDDDDDDDDADDDDDDDDNDDDDDADTG